MFSLRVDFDAGKYQFELVAVHGVATVDPSDTHDLFVWDVKRDVGVDHVEALKLLRVALALEPEVLALEVDGSAVVQEDAQVDGSERPLHHAPSLSVRGGLSGHVS